MATPFRASLLHPRAEGAGRGACKAYTPGVTEAAMSVTKLMPRRELEIVLVVNGAERRLTVDARTTLLDALRDRLHLTGTKKGCDLGHCGACTVLVQGRRINACLTLAVAHQGESITTIEGLAEGAGRARRHQSAAAGRHRGRHGRRVDRRHRADERRRRPSADSRGLSSRRGGAAAEREPASAQHGVDRWQPAAAHALRVLPRCGH